MWPSCFPQGFFCKDENDIDDLCRRLRKVKVSTLKVANHIAVFKNHYY